MTPIPMAGMDVPFTPLIPLGSMGLILMKSNLNGDMWLVAPVLKQKGVLIDEIAAISSTMSLHVVFLFHMMETFSFVGSCSILDICPSSRWSDSKLRSLSICLGFVGVRVEAAVLDLLSSFETWALSLSLFLFILS